MHRYNWIQPHQFNQKLALAVAEEKLNVVGDGLTTTIAPLSK